MGDKYVGYWPKSIFTSLAEGASEISWGGEVYSPINELSPAMGSGHFPQEGYGKAAFVNQLKVLYDRNSNYGDPYKYALKMYTNSPLCYNGIHNVAKVGDWGHYIYFGGPGSCTFQVK